MRSLSSRIGVVILLGLVTAAGLLAAPAPASADERPISVRTFVSSSYVYNLNKPAGDANALRVFDADHNAIKLDVAQISVQNLPAAPKETGFRLDVVAGHSVPSVVAADPGCSLDLHQGFVSWIAPVGAGLKVEAGKFYTHLGYEVIEGVDGWNEQSSRSFLFGYAVPFLHTGARASLALSPKLSVMAGLVNGWDNHRENNHSKSLIGQAAITAAEGLTFAVNGVYGPEQAGNDSRNRAVIDLVGSMVVTPKLKLGINVDYGTEDVAPTKTDEDESVSWSGVAGYARAELRPGFFLNLRGEHFNDADGIRTGAGEAVKLTEVTITPEFKLSEQMAIRAELRVDSADEKIFSKTTDEGVEMKKTQPTIGLNWVCSF